MVGRRLAVGGQGVDKKRLGAIAPNLFWKINRWWKTRGFLESEQGFQLYH